MENDTPKNEKGIDIMANDKMTNAKALAYVLNSCDMPTEVAEKIQNIYNSTVNKANSKKATPAQEATIEAMEVLAENMADNTLYRVAELQAKFFDDTEKFSTARLTSALKKLVEAGTVENVKDGKKSFYVKRG